MFVYTTCTSKIPSSIEKFYIVENTLYKSIEVNTLWKSMEI